MTATLQTENSAFGFYGTIAHDADPDRAWEIAMTRITEATACSEYGVRAFLDAREGRHFADTVADALALAHPQVGGDAALDAAIRSAIGRWMGWSISKRLSRETGIPEKLPMLTGFVLHYEMLADAL